METSKIIKLLYTLDLNLNQVSLPHLLDIFSQISIQNLPENVEFSDLEKFYLETYSSLAVQELHDSKLETSGHQSNFINRSFLIEPRADDMGNPVSAPKFSLEGENLLFFKVFTLILSKIYLNFSCLEFKILKSAQKHLKILADQLQLNQPGQILSILQKISNFDIFYCCVIELLLAANNSEVENLSTASCSSKLLSNLLADQQITWSKKFNFLKNFENLLLQTEFYEIFLKSYKILPKNDACSVDFYQKLLIKIHQKDSKSSNKILVQFIKNKSEAKTTEFLEFILKFSEVEVAETLVYPLLDFSTVYGLKILTQIVISKVDFYRNFVMLQPIFRFVELTRVRRVFFRNFSKRSKTEFWVYLKN